MASTATDSMELETLLNTKREDLPSGIRYVTGGSIFRHQRHNHPSTTPDPTSTSSPNPSNNEPQLLILKRSITESAYPSHWEVPGGSLEAHESVLAGLRREISEETSLIVTNVLTRLGDNVFESRDARNGKLRKWIQFHFVVEVESTKDELVKLDPKEHEEWRWVRQGETEGYLRLEGQRRVMEEGFEWVKKKKKQKQRQDGEEEEGKRGVNGKL